MQSKSLFVFNFQNIQLKHRKLDKNTFINTALAMLLLSTTFTRAPTRSVLYIVSIRTDKCGVLGLNFYIQVLNLLIKLYSRSRRYFPK